MPFSTASSISRCHAGWNSSSSTRRPERSWRTIRGGLSLASKPAAITSARPSTRAELAAVVLERGRALAAQALEQREVSVEQVVAAALGRQPGRGDVGLGEGHRAIQPPAERRVKTGSPGRGADWIIPGVAARPACAYGCPMTVTPARERVDVVVVGARCAGAAAAIALANAGRSVIAIDRSPFPSDTLSTHLNFPSAVAEMQRLGALPRIRRSGAPECREGMVATQTARGDQPLRAGRRDRLRALQPAPGVRPGDGRDGPRGGRRRARAHEPRRRALDRRAARPACACASRADASTTSTARSSSAPTGAARRPPRRSAPRVPTAARATAAASRSSTPTTRRSGRSGATA